MENLSETHVLDPLRMIYYIDTNGYNLFINNIFNTEIKLYRSQPPNITNMQYDTPLIDISHVDILNNFYSIYNKSEWITLCNKLNAEKQYMFSLKRIFISGVHVFFDSLTDKEKKELIKTIYFLKPLNLNATKEDILQTVANV